jgi:hypothetical protein
LFVAGLFSVAHKSRNATSPITLPVLVAFCGRRSHSSRAQETSLARISGLVRNSAVERQRSQGRAGGRSGWKKQSDTTRKSGDAIQSVSRVSAFDGSFGSRNCSQAATKSSGFPFSVNLFPYVRTCFGFPAPPRCVHCGPSLLFPGRAAGDSPAKSG